MHHSNSCDIEFKMIALPLNEPRFYASYYVVFLKRRKSRRRSFYWIEAYIWRAKLRTSREDREKIEIRFPSLCSALHSRTRIFHFRYFIFTFFLFFFPESIKYLIVKFFIMNHDWLKSSLEFYRLIVKEGFFNLWVSLFALIVNHDSSISMLPPE